MIIIITKDGAKRYKTNAVIEALIKHLQVWSHKSEGEATFLSDSLSLMEEKEGISDCVAFVNGFVDEKFKVKEIIVGDIIYDLSDWARHSFEKWCLEKGAEYANSVVIDTKDWGM